MKPRITTRALTVVLWLAFALALGASISHLAWTFGTLEHAPWVGWIPAIAVDLGMAGIAYGIQQRKRARRGAVLYWLALAVFAFISAAANLYHALAWEAGSALTVSGLGMLDWLAIAKAVILSAALPGLAIVLAEIVSADDAREADRQAEAERREVLRQARQVEAERLRVEAERAMALEVAPVSEWVCNQCGYEAKSQNALAGHMGAHARKDAK